PLPRIWFSRGKRMWSSQTMDTLAGAGVADVKRPLGSLALGETPSDPDRGHRVHRLPDRPRGDRPRRRLHHPRHAGQDMAPDRRRRARRRPGRAKGQQAWTAAADLTTSKALPGIAFRA